MIRLYLRLRSVLHIAAQSLAGCAALALLVNLWIPYSSAKYRGVARAHDAAIVLGGKVHPDGEPSSHLRHRLDLAVELFREGVVPRLLCSGDHGTPQYDEVNAMRTYLLRRGIPARVIFLDHAGFDTYQSMARARHIFGLERPLVVTQDFHLDRAIYVARAVGMNARGVPAAPVPEYALANRGREFLARVKSLLEASVEPPTYYGGAKVELAQGGLSTWDVVQ